MLLKSNITQQTHQPPKNNNIMLEFIKISKFNNTAHLLLKISGQPLCSPHVVFIIYLECLHKKKTKQRPDPDIVSLVFARKLLKNSTKNIQFCVFYQCRNIHTKT